MSDNSWFFMKNYSPDGEESKVVDIEKRIDNLDKKIDRLETKLDKLIESNKSLIAYFSARDARDLNYNIRGFSKGNMSPIGFVPDKRL